jgi:hypothetical protein
VALWIQRGALSGPFPVWAGSAERLRRLLDYAIRAPSRHNCQPWLFEIDGTELAVSVDRRRRLKAADPHGREALMACGAAVENLVLAAGHHGHSTDVEVLAGRGGGELAARVWLTGRRAPPAEHEPLVRAISARHTPSAIRAVSMPDGLVAELEREAALEGATLRLVNPRRLRAVAEVLADADAVQRSSARFCAEHASWTHRRPASSPREERPASARGLPRVLSRLLVRFRGSATELERRIAALGSGVFLLSTRGDAPADWFRAGRAMQRVLLRATAARLDASYLSAAVEVPGARARLRRALFEPGHPQLLFQLGHGSSVRSTRRRPVALVLRSFTTGTVVEVPDSGVA